MDKGFSCKHLYKFFFLFQLCVCVTVSSSIFHIISLRVCYDYSKILFFTFCSMYVIPCYYFRIFLFLSFFLLNLLSPFVPFFVYTFGSTLALIIFFLIFFNNKKKDCFGNYYWMRKIENIHTRIQQNQFFKISGPLLCTHNLTEFYVDKCLEKENKYYGTWKEIEIEKKEC